MSTQIAQIREAFRNKSYGPAPESRELADIWLAKHRASPHGIGHFIDGEFGASASKKTFPTVNPGKRQRDGSLETLADIALGDAADVDRAISSAKSVVIFSFVCLRLTILLYVFIRFQQIINIDFIFDEEYENTSYHQYNWMCSLCSLWNTSELFYSNYHHQCCNCCNQYFLFVCGDGIFKWISWLFFRF